MRTNLWDNDPCDRHGNPMCTVCTLIRLHDKIDLQADLLREAKKDLENIRDCAKQNASSVFITLRAVEAIAKLEGIK